MFSPYDIYLFSLPPPHGSRLTRVEIDGLRAGPCVLSHSLHSRLRITLPSETLSCPEPETESGGERDRHCGESSHVIVVTS